MQSVVMVLLGVIQLIITGSAVVLWSLFNEMRANMKELDEEFNDYRVEVAKQYVSRDEFKEAISAIKEALDTYSSRWDARFDRIEQKLDNKADK